MRFTCPSNAPFETATPDMNRVIHQFSVVKDSGSSGKVEVFVKPHDGDWETLGVISLNAPKTIQLFQSVISTIKFVPDNNVSSTYYAAYTAWGDSQVKYFI